MAAGSFAEKALEALARKGFAKRQVCLTETDRHEIEAEFGRPSLLRTNHDASLTLTGIIDEKRVQMTINRLTDEALEEAVEELWADARGSQPDPANDIAPSQPAKRFARGAEAADAELMYERLAELLDHARRQYPSLTVRQSAVDFEARRERHLNSNGIDFEAYRGRYQAQVMFSAREGDRVSSFNGTGFTREALDEPLHACATTDALMRQSTEEVHTRQIPEKFTGDLVITPDCLESFLGFLLQQISDGPLISGTSIYKDRLGERVTSDLISLESRPLDLPSGYFVTGDGCEARNAAVLENGVLATYLLSLYGANKTGLARADTGRCWVVAPGETPRERLIGDVERGILITRFSGGRPSDKGDFSGVAKNSYYIENGELRYPLSETMVSGNLADLLGNIVAVSRERADFGARVVPWVRASGIGVS